MHRIGRGLYRNEKYLIHNDLGWWYVYCKYHPNELKYTGYVSMHKTLKAALKSLNLEITK